MDIKYSNIVYLLTPKLPGKQNTNSSFHNHSFIHSGSETLNRLGMVVQTTSALWRQFVVNLIYRVSFWTTRAAQKKLGLERKEGRKEGKGKKVIVSNHPYPPLKMGSVRMILEEALALFLLSSHLLPRGKASPKFILWAVRGPTPY